MPVFLSTQGFQKYNLFPQPPPIASQIGRRSLEEARFPANFRRAFLGKASRSGDNHHHPEVDLFVLYTVVYPIAQIHHRLTVFPSIIPSPARSSMAAATAACSLAAPAAVGQPCLLPGRLLFIPGQPTTATPPPRPLLPSLIIFSVGCACTVTRDYCSAIQSEVEEGPT